MPSLSDLMEGLKSGAGQNATALDQIADHLDVSRERVRQLEKLARWSCSALPNWGAHQRRSAGTG